GSGSTSEGSCRHHAGPDDHAESGDRSARREPWRSRGAATAEFTTERDDTAVAEHVHLGHASWPGDIDSWWTTVRRVSDAVDAGQLVRESVVSPDAGSQVEVHG